MKATAVAPANIALIKYWGKKDSTLRIPLNPSISMNLSACTTTTTVEFSDDFEKDVVTEGFDRQRIIQHLDRFRTITQTHKKARMSTKNSFPTSAGIASSASGFAALTMAASAALGLKFSEKELTGFARLGSGSACRSIPDGFVKWEGEAAHSLYPETHWDLRDIIVIVEHTEKKVSSSAGHDLVHTSPNLQKRLADLPNRIVRIEEALRTKNFQMFGEVIEEECLDMHHVMQTQNPPLFYWNDTTKTIMDAVRTWRKEGLPVYFTIDAGPNVHLMCEGMDERRVLETLKTIVGIESIIFNKSAPGAHVIEMHLF